VYVAFRFVTLDGVTIPGKGGRPRKWRSDADRVRAYRARQRGDSEPPVLAVALGEGDELAASLEHSRELGERLVEQRKAERALRSELAAARRELEAQRARFGWLRQDNDALRAKLAEAVLARNEVEHRLKELARLLQRERLKPTRPAATPPVETTETPSANRAQRRRAGRIARHRQ
jgi:hypothetical protein